MNNNLFFLTHQFNKPQRFTNEHDKIVHEQYIFYVKTKRPIVDVH